MATAVGHESLRDTFRLSAFPPARPARPARVRPVTRVVTDAQGRQRQEPSEAIAGWFDTTLKRRSNRSPFLDKRRPRRGGRGVPTLRLDKMRFRRWGAGTCGTSRRMVFSKGA